MAQYYFTAQYAEPVVYLRGMGCVYLKHDEACYMLTTRQTSIPEMLSTVGPGSGRCFFGFVETGELTLSIQNARGSFLHVSWPGDDARELCEMLTTIQRFFRAALRRKQKPLVKNLAAFQLVAKALPYEIFYMIVAYVIK
jgi:hypothetical protein